ncbi:hypothetical protein DCS_04699 [Drechmeria coniospora]|uniref:N-acetylglucosamine-induced protein 1 n=1 Tax=Drechmeria coniospora TaxID=98403 RepID=A0A151GKS1_DRECN|nr:hypothetical protein DCS_04699 [Drechmeria coniospora]KYK57686.1 hypothetical protein DCS_04699 [Drechmeria coniospora]ODA79576.1 hypothetical protein RJ55_05170 [Drechmeria coniospora]
MDLGPPDHVPYWQYNVSEGDKTTDCPPFLLNLSDKDRRIIGTPDSAYAPSSWSEVCALVSSNRLDLFQRAPSQLRRYKAYTYRLGREHGSVQDFILRERLGWTQPVRPRGRPFQFPDDIRIIYNDWPYGLDPNIVHLVVWTKFALESDGENGELTDAARVIIEAFVTTTFRQRVPPNQVVWFKNWSALRSIDLVEHFHVMMFGPDPDFVRQVTNGDVPQYMGADV